jgi:hypothetical protein
MNRLRKSVVYITIARTPDWSCASGLGRVYSMGDRVFIVTHRVSSGIFGSTSGANRPEIVADRVITRLFPIKRLTIGLESRLHRVFSPKRGNIGSLRVSFPGINRYVIVITSGMCKCYPDKLTRSYIFSPMSPESPRFPHRGSIGH